MPNPAKGAQEMRLTEYLADFWLSDQIKTLSGSEIHDLRA